MVSRNPPTTDAGINVRPSNGIQLPSRDGQVVGTPRQLNKEPSTPKPAQDAELKDYVCWFKTPRPMCIYSNIISNLGDVLERELLDLSLER